jgi:hypothetical protein
MLGKLTVGAAAWTGPELGVLRYSRVQPLAHLIGRQLMVVGHAPAGTQPATPAATVSLEWCSCRAFSASCVAGLRSKTTFLMVPVKAYGALSS